LSEFQRNMRSFDAADILLNAENCFENRQLVKGLNRRSYEHKC